MILYHGSKYVIEHPGVKGSNPTNDYGPAFYLTSDIDAAKAWACRNDSVGVVNQYSLDARVYQNLRILDLIDKAEYGILNWLAILMHYRTLDASFKRNNALALEWLQRYYIDIDAYDVVIGFRADDAYFRFPIRFLTNDLAYEDLESVYRSGDLGVQYAFVSKRAMDLLHFEKAMDCEIAFLGRYYTSVTEATKGFNALLNQPRDPQKTYILDLMRKDNG